MQSEKSITTIQARQLEMEASPRSCGQGPSWWPGVLVGIVPMDADLTAQWEEYDNPLPKVDPGPFDAASTLANLSHGSTDMNLACEANRPQGTTEKKIRNTKEQTQRRQIH